MLTPGAKRDTASVSGVVDRPLPPPPARLDVTERDEREVARVEHGEVRGAAEDEQRERCARASRRPLQAGSRAARPSSILRRARSAGGAPKPATAGRQDPLELLASPPIRRAHRARRRPAARAPRPSASRGRRGRRAPRRPAPLAARRRRAPPGQPRGPTTTRPRASGATKRRCTDAGDRRRRAARLGANERLGVREQLERPPERLRRARCSERLERGRPDVRRRVGGSAVRRVGGRDPGTGRAAGRRRSGRPRSDARASGTSRRPGRGASRSSSVATRSGVSSSEARASTSPSSAHSWSRASPLRAVIAATRTSRSSLRSPCRSSARASVSSSSVDPNSRSAGAAGTTQSPIVSLAGPQARRRARQRPIGIAAASSSQPPHAIAQIKPVSPQSPSLGIGTPDEGGAHPSGGAL